MPLAYGIDPQRRLVVNVGNGTLEDAHVIEYQREVWSLPELAGYDELIDMTEVEHLALPAPPRVVDLAELSAGNLNVANEVGLAHGANRPTFLVIRDGVAPPSNLADLLILRYDPRRRGWPQDDIGRLARFVRVHWRAYVRSITDESLIHTTAHQLLQMLLAVGHPVPNSIRALARAEGRSKKKMRR